MLSDLRLVMTIDAGTVHLELVPWAGGPAADTAGSEQPPPTVTIVLSYPDAAAMSQGHLSPAEALNAGRIRVRGDLAALAASQQILNQARNGFGDRLPPTTY